MYDLRYGVEPKLNNCLFMIKLDTPEAADKMISIIDGPSVGKEFVKELKKFYADWSGEITVESIPCFAYWELLDSRSIEQWKEAFIEECKAENKHYVFISAYDIENISVDIYADEDGSIVTDFGGFDFDVPFDWALDRTSDCGVEDASFPEDEDEDADFL